jgi:hypothetical protein
MFQTFNVDKRAVLVPKLLSEMFHMSQLMSTVPMTDPREHEPQLLHAYLPTP